MNLENKILVNIDKLLPTQFCLGFHEVEYKKKYILKMKKKALNDYMIIKVVPVVLGPKNKIYLIDHHHHIRSLHELKIKQAYVSIVADYSKLSVKDFFTKMEDMKYLNLFDKNGIKQSFKKLPLKISDLSHDYYRSLAWGVREEDGFTKVDHIPFFEFRWGDFYRKYIKEQIIIDDFQLAIKMALELSKSKLASKLPGFNKGSK